MAQELYVCYDKAGKKYELTRPNWKDCVERFGFSTSPPTFDVKDEEEVSNETETDDISIGDESEEVADEPEDGENKKTDEVAFADMEREELKNYLDTNFPDYQYDGRAGQVVLVEIAENLTNGEQSE